MRIKIIENITQSNIACSTMYTGTPDKGLTYKIVVSPEYWCTFSSDGFLVVLSTPNRKSNGWGNKYLSKIID